ncbi:unnamed protein product [Ranitomeya imitator]|uniref:ribonuclease H n=1 Tax=Ranitomeya imitator TaxID=111125 RepID=A0ABN9MNL4_9NEOB|nr:unnamed protein product [Ranitomeya imitator]
MILKTVRFYELSQAKSVNGEEQGPRTEPCGTPTNRGRGEEVVCERETLKVRSVRNDEIQDRAKSVIPRDERDESFLLRNRTGYSSLSTTWDNTAPNLTSEETKTGCLYRASFISWNAISASVDHLTIDVFVLLRRSDESFLLRNRTGCSSLSTTWDNTAPNLTSEVTKTGCLYRASFISWNAISASVDHSAIDVFVLLRRSKLHSLSGFGISTMGLDQLFDLDDAQHSAHLPGDHFMAGFGNPIRLLLHPHILVTRYSSSSFKLKSGNLDESFLLRNRTGYSSLSTTWDNTAPNLTSEETKTGCLYRASFISWNAISASVDHLTIDVFVLLRRSDESFLLRNRTGCSSLSTTWDNTAPNLTSEVTKTGCLYRASFISWNAISASVDHSAIDVFVLLRRSKLHSLSGFGISTMGLDQLFDLDDAQHSAHLPGDHFMAGFGNPIRLLLHPHIKADFYKDGADLLAINHLLKLTTSLGFGMSQVVGHLDLFPNGGIHMPGCPQYIEIPNVNVEDIWNVYFVFSSLLISGWPCASMNVQELVSRVDQLTARALGLLYDEPNSVDQAEKTLLALSQGQEEAELYCQKFRKWSVLTKWNNDALAAIFRKGLSESVKDVMDVFDEPKSSFLPPHRDCDCAIDLIPGCKFPKGRLFNLSVPEHAAMRSYIKESLEKGHIQPSSSPLGAGFFFVAKKDGFLRHCIDYRLLNKITVKFQYPLPLLSDLFARIKGASWFIKIDLRGAYNLVRIKQGDEWKTAFNTPEGHFEYLVMPFGLSNAPSVFQSFMHDIFWNYLDKFLIVYLDDILIFSDDWESHVQQVEVDASEIGAGAVLSQRDPVDSLMKPCAFFSRKFSPAERNYDLGNWELLAMKWAFEEWRHWLEGDKHHIVVLTDHKNLIYLESAKWLNPRQARWSLFFSRFDFVVSYLPGSKNIKADALSRSFLPDSPEVLEPVGILKEGVVLSAISPDLRWVLQEFQADKPDRCPVGKLFVPDRWTSRVEPSDCPGVDSVVDRLQQIWAHVMDNLVLSQEEAQRFANHRRCVGSRFLVGDLVWLSSRHVPMKVSSPKFKPRFIGPYRISEIINPVSFRLALPASFAIHNVFHRSLLRKYVEPVVPSVDPPAPVLVDGELEYVVEKILDSRFSRRKLQYLVKWKGYGQEDNSWVFASDVHAADLVRASHLAHPDRPGGSEHIEQLEDQIDVRTELLSKLRQDIKKASVLTRSGQHEDNAVASFVPDTQDLDETVDIQAEELQRKKFHDRAARINLKIHDQLMKIVKDIPNFNDKMDAFYNADIFESNTDKYNLNDEQKNKIFKVWLPSHMGKRLQTTPRLNEEHEQIHSEATPTAEILESLRTNINEDPFAFLVKFEQAYRMVMEIGPNQEPTSMIRFFVKKFKYLDPASEQMASTQPSLQEATVFIDRVRRSMKQNQVKAKIAVVHEKEDSQMKPRPTVTFQSRDYVDHRGAQLSVTNLDLKLQPDSPVCTIVGFSGKGGTKATLVTDVTLEIPSSFKTTIDIWYCRDSENILGTDFMQKFGWVVDLGNQVIWKDSNGCKPVVIDPSDYSYVGSICLNDVVSAEHLWPETGGDEVLTEIVQLFPSLWAQFRNEVGLMKNYVDDILLSTEDKESHVSLLKELFELLHDAGLKLNTKKVKLMQTELQGEEWRILGYFSKLLSPVERGFETCARHLVERNFTGKRWKRQYKMLSNHVSFVPKLIQDQKDRNRHYSEPHLQMVHGLHYKLTTLVRYHQEEMDSNKSWNTKHHGLDGRESTPILQEKTTFPKKSYYLMGITFLLLCTISTVIYAEDILHRGTNISEVNEPFERTLHSRKPRGSSLQNLIDEDIPDNSVDITGNICMGYGAKCCIELHFIHDTNITLHATTGPKTGFIQLQGDYIHNNKTGTWECNPTDVLFWNIEIKGEEKAVWSGDITNDMIPKGKFGTSKTDIWLKTQLFGKILDPSLLSITEGDEDWVKTWNFQITREPVQVQVSVIFTVTNTIVPEVRVTPQTVHSQENMSPLSLKCNTRLELPSESLLTWTKDRLFLGSFSNGPTNVIHRGQSGNVRWLNKNLVFSVDNPSPKDSGLYQCCVLTKNNYKQCKDVNVNIWSAVDNVCTQTRFQPSTPFQINQFQSKPLLREGVFISPVSHLINMEMGIEQWFGKRTPAQVRSKRGVLEGILGGLGTVGSLINTMDIHTLKSNLENVGFIGGKGIKIQKSLNQVLEKMVLNTAAVLGSSVSHLQDATLALIESEQESQVAKTCLEIQIEYSTNLKMIAQALQSGITPLGLMRNLPTEYNFALNHTDLWDIVPVYQIKGISKLFKLCLPKVQCFCDSLTSPPSERQFNALLMSVASLLANDPVPSPGAMPVYWKDRRKNYLCIQFLYFLPQLFKVLADCRCVVGDFSKWLGCEQDICVGTSLIPVSGREKTLVPIAVLGIPVSRTQLLYYQLQYTDFAFEGTNIEQVDISSCLNFVSKVMCLPGQDKVIYHLCFHNHTSCHARVENVHTIHDLVTPVSANKICFQVLSEKEVVSAFFSSCVHTENLTIGLYCIEGNVKTLSKKEGSINITSIGSRNLKILPIQFNLSQINNFPWNMWTNEIKKDKGLLNLLTKQLKEAEIVFRHEQGNLNDIEHEWTSMSGSSWWKNLGKSVNSWSQSSAKMAVGNVLSNPIVIVQGGAR